MSHAIEFKGTSCLYVTLSSWESSTKTIVNIIMYVMCLAIYELVVNRTMLTWGTLSTLHLFKLMSCLNVWILDTYRCEIKWVIMLKAGVCIYVREDYWTANQIHARQSWWKFIAWTSDDYKRRHFYIPIKVFVVIGLFVFHCTVVHLLGCLHKIPKWRKSNCIYW